MSIVVESDLLGWIANEADQIASGLDDGSMSPGVACRYLRNIARKIAAESESTCEGLVETVENDRHSAFSPAPNRLRWISPGESDQSEALVSWGDIGPLQRVVKSRRCWQMRVLDLDTGEVRFQKMKLTRREAASVFEQWQAKRINALVFFVPDWAYLSVSIRAELPTT